MALRQGVTRFCKNDLGSISVLALATALIMAIMLGIGIDYMHSELRRTKMQHVLDRATLAAANGNDRRDPQEVIDDYLQAAGMDTQIETGGSHSATVRLASGHGTVVTHSIFGQITGVNAFSADVHSVASSAGAGVEIALTLDISASMYYNNRFPKMKTAAKDFVDSVLGPNADFGTALTIVPFSGAVNLGRDMQEYIIRTNALAASEIDDYGSGCIEVRPEHFDRIGLPENADTIPYFVVYNNREPGKQWGWCPHTDSARVQYALTDAAEAASFIDGLPMFDGTGGDIAMQTSLALLAPSSQAAIQHVVAARGGDTVRAASYPAEWDDPQSAKFIVYMSDGENTAQIRPTDGRNPDIWRRSLRSLGSDHITSILDTSRDWHWLLSYTATLRMLGQCRMAKDKGITIYTVAFETNDWYASLMSQCASSPAHAYHVNGDDLSLAFGQIAGSIMRGDVRLIQ